MAPTLRDYYEILGVARDATAEEIHRAYRRLARRYHPDVNAGEDARARFGELSGAYEVLHDPDQRARYDRRTGAAPAFTRHSARPDVPRFLDEEAGRWPTAGSPQPAYRLVVVWDLPHRPRFGFQPPRRRWPAAWWLR